MLRIYVYCICYTWVVFVYYDKPYEMVMMMIGWFLFHRVNAMLLLLWWLCSACTPRGGATSSLSSLLRYFSRWSLSICENRKVIFSLHRLFSEGIQQRARRARIHSLHHIYVYDGVYVLRGA